MIITEGTELTEGNIADAQGSNKCFGIPQANENHEEAARKSATVRYLQRVLFGQTYHEGAYELIDWLIDIFYTKVRDSLPVSTVTTQVTSKYVLKWPQPSPLPPPPLSSSLFRSSAPVRFGPPR